MSEKAISGKHQNPEVPPTAGGQQASKDELAEPPPPGSTETDRGDRRTLIVALAGAIALVALGQHIFTSQPGSKTTGLLLVLSGIGLFILGRHLYLKRDLPGWVSGVGAQFDLLRFQLVVLGLAIVCAFMAHSFAGDGPKMINPAAALLVWLAALGMVILGSYGAGSPSGDHPTEALSGGAWSRREMATLLALFLFAFLVRWAANGDIPHGLSGDEGSAGLVAVSMLEGRFNNPFTMGWYSFPSLFFFIPAIFIGVLGHTYEALRTPAALAGALTVVGLYWLARPLFGKATAALSAIMLAGLGFHVHFSRIGLNNVWDGLVTVFALGMFWRGWQTGRRGYFFGAGLLLGLSQYLYASARLLPILLLAWLVLAFVYDRKQFKSRLPDLFRLGMVAMVVFLPLGLYYLNHPDEFLAPMVRFGILSGDWIEATSRATGQAPWQVLLENLRNAALGFTSIPLRNWYNSGRPMLLALPAGLFVLGVTLAILNLRDPRYWLVLLWLLGVVFIGGLTESTPASQRYVIGAPVAALMVAIPLATIGEWMMDGFPRGRTLVYGAMAGIMLLAVVLELRFYFGNYAPGAGQGDINTQVAGRMGLYLAKYPPASEAFFFGPPRMGYHGFGTISFLAPQVIGQDVPEVLAGPPGWELSAPRTAFIFLPERQAESAFVTNRYPGGNSQWFYASNGTPLFLLYEVAGP